MTTSDTQPPVDDLAPTPEAELLPEVVEAEEKAKEEGEGGEEGKDGGGKKGGGGGGGGGKKPAAEKELEEKDFFSEQDLSEYDSESLIEKLKMLVWAPFSSLVPGASSFESEQDLKRKMFLGQIGLITNQIELHDIADPNFIAKLEKRNQERQAALKAEIDARTAGSAAGLAAGLSVEAPPPEAVQKREMKQQISQPKEISLDSRQEMTSDKQELQPEQKAFQETAFSTEQISTEEDDSEVAAKNPEPGDFERKELKQEPMLDVGEILEMLDKNEPKEAVSFERSEPKSGLDATAAISGLFNAFAQKTDYAAGPEQKMEFKFADPAPKMDMGAMGKI